MEILAAISTFIGSVVIGGVGLFITSKYNKTQHKLASDRIMKELFTEFNARYDHLNDKLENIKENYQTIDKFESIKDSKLKMELRTAIVDFFNLCAEEKYWHKKGRIDEEIWRSWHSGMNYWYKNVPVIRSTWNHEIKDDNGLSYYITNGDEFFDES